ncbi:MAG TPA: acyl-CoA dehydrogenase family protein [Kineosporiaceae bacterium]|nr:acyl-CoA dehydrogenase family protein [Kineosporiaceae bacterium]
MSRIDLDSTTEPEISQDEDLLELRSTLRRLLARHTADLSTPAGDFDRPLWALLSQQVGVAGLAVPERLGGSGGGYLECHLVLEELGRTGAATPFLASAVLATQALLLSGTAAAADLLPDLAAGTRTATLMWGTGCELTATGDGDSWVVDGRARPVLDGGRADLLLAFAQPSAGSAALFLLDTAHSGLHRALLPTMDQSLHLAEVNCRAVPARLLSRPGDVRPTDARPTGPGEGADPASRLADLAAIAITAEQVGGARRCLELTVEYAKNRVQFGRPIGSFQAVKHRLADLLVLLESADSASQAAAMAWVTAAEDASMLASLAKSYCSEAYRAVTAETIQLHGGLGFTWEHPAHRYFKRAHSTSALFGDPTYHRSRLAEQLGLLDPPGPAK